ncbi:hypothetical protein [Bradyrhizobium sp. CCBAU 51753]|uniref:hypothetical protein n=1 Tax=Bradyrhizobium sp. CCBAU 51753 TaxID=1325100 RepID=UPI00188AA204|nr:hypothetical protein [Bradyrhizobium sp. CCBAU 51753]QOZ25330.1 hypothetical protein XH93_18315 [Bradyrhizobium sp. CCBAU 51753]
MSNVDVDDRTERRSALDAFASAPVREVQAPSVLPMASTGDRVFGAQQVAVYRDEARVFQKLAALGAAAGDDWFYRFPVRKKVKDKETGKEEWVTDYIEGASIKLANDVARIYGNCEVDTRVIDMGTSWLIYARFTDFETGYALTRPFQQNKGGSKLGGDDNARKLDIAFQIGVSKAIRNVVVNALQTYSDYAFDAARSSLVEKIGKNLAGYRDRTVQGIGNLGVELSRVEAVTGKSAKDWTAPDVAKVIAMMKAIADGMATVDETFPPKGASHDPETGEVKETTQSTAQAEAAAPSQGAGAGTAEPADQKQQTASGPDQAGSATNSTASTQPTENTPPGTVASGQAASNPSPPKQGDGAAAGPESDASNMTAPKTEAEYIKYSDAWIAALTDATAGEARWKEEKTLRNKAHVGSDAREAQQEKLAKKCAEIRDADRS